MGMHATCLLLTSQGHLKDRIQSFLWTQDPPYPASQKRSRYQSIPGHWTLEEAPPDHGLRLSSASGHDIQIVGRFYCSMNFQGRQIRRPMYVLRGLARHKAILGIDFVKEQHLAIDASGPHFTEAARLLPDDICPFFSFFYPWRSPAP